MAVLSSTKVRLVIHTAKEQEVIRFLQDREILHITSEQMEREEAVHEGTHKWGEIETSLRFLSSYGEPKKKFSEFLLGEKILATPAEMEKLVKTFEIDPFLKNVQTLEIRKNQLEAKLSKLSEQKMLIAEWQEIEETAVLQSERFSLLFCRFPRSSEKSLQDTLATLPEMSHFEILGTTQNSLLGLLIFASDTESQVRSFLMDLDGAEVRLDLEGNSPRKKYLQLEKDQKDIMRELRKLTSEIKVIATENIPKLKLLSDHYFWQKQREEALQRGEKKNSVMVLEGWVPTHEYDTLQAALYEKFPETHLEKIEPEEEENAPLQLKNGPFFRPFEIVTRIFGLPHSTELDPTPFLAPFFIFFFAFCLTDAGYGIILTLLAAGVLKFFHMEDGMKQMMRLLLMGGVMTIVLGTLFGGWFGIEVSKLPVILQEIQIIDPLPDLMTRLAPMTLALGFLQLWFGVVLAGVTKVKNGEAGEAWMTSFPLAMTLIGAVLWGIFAALGNAVLVGYIKIVMLILAIIMFWGFGYGVRNLLIRPFVSVLRMANEGMSWLSNLFSYCRLFALGLATGMVAQVFNSLAFILGDLVSSVPGLNILMIITIILFGHVLNIALNLLGAFIQSGRLQFIEFFGKFLNGGGAEFIPIRKNSKYFFSS